MGNPVVHFEIISRNAKQLHEFYAKAFDWHVDTNNPMGYGMVDTHGEGGIGGGIGSPSEEDETYLTFYVNVPDISGALKAIEKLGGKTVMPRTELPGVVIAQFVDPDGNRVGLTEGM